MNRPQKNDYMNDSYAYDCEYLNDLEKYCDEIEAKLKRNAYPRFMPCKCGHNRRNRYVRSTKGKRYFINECKKCGVRVEGLGEVGAIRKWNEVMMND